VDDGIVAVRTAHFGRLIVSGDPSHPVYFTTTTIEYNQPAQSITITIEAYGEDFEHAVKQHAGRSVNLHGAASGKGSTEVMTYLNEKFVLKDRAGRGVALTLAKFEKPFEKSDDQFDLRISQTALMAMQCFANIAKLISLANGFSTNRPGAGISSWFGRLNGKPIWRLKTWRGSS